MNPRRAVLAAVLACVVLLLLSGCPNFLTPAMEGEWKLVGEQIVFGGVDYMAFTECTAIFGSGTYDFEYTIVDPYPDGDVTVSSHTGTMSPAEPEVGDGIVFTATTSSGTMVPPPETTFSGEVLHMDRNILVLNLQTGGELMLAWTFERQ